MSAHRANSKGGNYAAPWCDALADGSLGPEYRPLSPRTGREVAQSSAERDWAEGHGYVGSAGLWDHQEGIAHGSRPPAPTLPRHDAEAMGRFMALKGSELTARQWEVYTRFWVEHRSYQVTASIVGATRRSVSKTVLELRRKAAISVRGSPLRTGYVPCPHCQAQTRVVKTRNKPGLVSRMRRCMECSYAFATAETPA